MPIGLGPQLGVFRSLVTLSAVLIRPRWSMVRVHLGPPNQAIVDGSQYPFVASVAIRPYDLISIVGPFLCRSGQHRARSSLSRILNWTPERISEVGARSAKVRSEPAFPNRSQSILHGCRRLSSSSFAPR